MNPHDHEQNLERLVHRTLRDLPLRRAPGTLEARVLAELERRAALPWWHKSYAHWPVAMRVVFLVATAAIAAGLVAALVAITHGLDPAQVVGSVTERFTWLTTARGLLDTGAGAAEAIWRAIPTFWLYGAAAFLAACYVTLIGVGAATYRTLYAQH